MKTIAYLSPPTLLLALLAACATSAADPTDPPAQPDHDVAPNLPSAAPGTPAQGCMKASDCNQGAPCTVGSCTAGSCVYAPMKCSPADSCETNECVPATGKCETAPKADGTDCSSLGTCAAGKCVPLASCFGPSPMEFIHCDGTSTSRDLSTGVFPSDRVSTYTCAAGEVARETALQFDPPAGAVVTVTLRVTDSVDVDLDLLVLDDSCSGKATCMNPSSAGKVAGVTLGTGTESVTFTAQASHSYYVVVDGKVATPANFTVTVACN